MYFSGAFSGGGIDEFFIERGLPRLFTCSYSKELFKNLATIKAMGIKKYKIMIDSGAFTAWNSGTIMTMRNLREIWDTILERYPNNSYVFISLDVIPGVRGKERTKEQYQKAIQESFNNYDELRKLYPNITILPVYHAPEPLYVMEHYLRCTQHFAISINAALSERERVKLLTSVFPECTNVKVHGLATTGLEMLRCVGWHSVDSATWVMIGAMGSILWPTKNNTQFLRIDISEHSKKVKVLGAHVNNAPMRKEVCAKIEEHGFDPQELATNYIARHKWNILRWSEINIVKPTKHQRRLFDA